MPIPPAANAALLAANTLFNSSRRFNSSPSAAILACLACSLAASSAALPA